jgi:transcription termination factor NusB
VEVEDYLEHHREVALSCDQKIIISGSFNIFQLTEPERVLVSDIIEAIRKFESQGGH